MRNCKWCNEILIGTLKKKFCNDKCKNGFGANKQKEIRRQKRLNKSKRYCLECDKDISNLHFNKKFCSDNHQEIYTKNKYFNERVKNQSGEGIKCHFCELISNSLIFHILNTHKMSIEEYKKQTNNSPIYSEKYLSNLSKKVSGEKNPGYQHGGTLSPWKRGSLNYSEAAVKKANENRTHSTRNEYWIKKGYSEEEATKKVSERQVTFSKEICIEKYGKEEGIKRWLERQEKWQNTLKSKSPEEIARINRLKVSSGCNISKAETEIFNKLKKYFPNVESQFLISHLNGFVYDIRLNNKIIEYNGSYWHCDPNLYDEFYYNKQVKKTAKQIWKYDEHKINLAKKEGYKILIIWERNYKNNPQESINDCIEFLANNE